MAFELPPLPYAKDALQPHISSETLDYHYGRHHQTYVTNLNNLTQGKPEADKTLEELIRTAPEGGLFNNAAQVWNHTFYWNSLSPRGGGEPSGEVAAAINGVWNNFQAFKDAFSAAAAGQFGSGWAWLILDKSGNLAITSTANQDNPLTDGNFPVLGNDVWEHAYYLKYQNRRPEYLSAWWNVVNWDVVAKRYAAAHGGH